jgi:hypothetical protein
VPRWLHALAAVVVAALGISVALAVVGIVIAAGGGSSYRTTIASALFIGGAVLFVWNAAAGGGTRGRRLEAFRHGTSLVTPEDPLGWVGAGLLVLGAGALVAFL